MSLRWGVPCQHRLAFAYSAGKKSKISLAGHQVINLFDEPTTLENALGTGSVYPIVHHVTVGIHDKGVGEHDARVGGSDLQVRGGYLAAIEQNGDVNVVLLDIAVTVFRLSGDRTILTADSLPR